MTALPDHKALDAQKPAGMLEYEARTMVRDLIRVYGFGGARELIALYLNDEAERTFRNEQH